MLGDKNSTGRSDSPKAVLEAGPTGAYRQAPAGRCLVGWAGGPAAAVGPASLIACLAGQAPI